jgi:hypothetical protein
MGSLDHPVLRTILLFAGALGITTAYVGLASYINWPPFGYYPSLGSPAYIAVYIVSLLFLGFIDWLRFRGHVKKDQLTVGVVRR